MNLKEDAEYAIARAESRTNGNASAVVCLQDAKHLAERGFYKLSLGRSLQSLAHSVGIFGDAYREIHAIVAEHDAEKL